MKVTRITIKHPDTYEYGLVDYCCERMKRAYEGDMDLMKSRKTIHILNEKVIFAYYGSGTNNIVNLDYCPFCGKEIQ